jgi:hypothetical protein
MYVIAQPYDVAMAVLALRVVVSPAAHYATDSYGTAA